MWKIIIWPLFIFVLHGYTIYLFKFHYPSGLGLELAGAGIFEILLIMSLLCYLGLIALYVLVQTFRKKNITLWFCIVVGILSLPLSLLMTRYITLLRIADYIFQSDWWWLGL
jgi:hypothetical protein